MAAAPAAACTARGPLSLPPRICAPATCEEGGQGEDGRVEVHDAQAGGVEVDGQEAVGHLRLKRGSIVRRGVACRQAARCQVLGRDGPHAALLLHLQPRRRGPLPLPPRKVALGGRRRQQAIRIPGHGGGHLAGQLRPLLRRCFRGTGSCVTQGWRTAGSWACRRQVGGTSGREGGERRWRRGYRPSGRGALGPRPFSGCSREGMRAATARATAAPITLAHGRRACGATKGSGRGCRGCCCTPGCTAQREPQHGEGGWHVACWSFKKVFTYCMKGLMHKEHCITTWQTAPLACGRRRRHMCAGQPPYYSRTHVPPKLSIFLGDSSSSTNLQPGRQP